MQKDIKRFFHPINQQMDIPDCEYDRIGLCIAMANALARNTNYSLYIIDYNRKNFLYVSSNPLFLCGHSPEDVQQKGYAFYFDVVPSTCPSSITFISVHQKSTHTLSTTN